MPLRQALLPKELSAEEIDTLQRILQYEFMMIELLNIAVIAAGYEDELGHRQESNKQLEQFGGKVMNFARDCDHFEADWSRRKMDRCNKLLFFSY